ncbi:hypothetical protein HYQ46_001298 [Verticillium longisporum]|nr:hypothetical protein HYQ46_001298 [Verticillium longisporum]
MPSTFSRLPSCDPSDRQDHAFESPNQDVQAPVICNHLSTDGTARSHAANAASAARYLALFAAMPTS